jgi:NAD(P)H-dependent flavin oxidoreductase YrpB (nitropropane dioxygenase family)
MGEVKERCNGTHQIYKRYSNIFRSVKYHDIFLIKEGVGRPARIQRNPTVKSIEITYGDG